MGNFSLGMTSLRIGFVVVALVAAATPPLLAHRHADLALRSAQALLQNQDKEMVDLLAANQALSNLLTNARLPTGRRDYTAELEKLRQQEQVLRKSIEQARKQTAASRRTACDRFFESSGQLAEHNHAAPHAHWVMGKSNDALAITDALLRYARAHDGNFPTRLEQAAEYLPQPHSPSSANLPITGTNDFDIVYAGSLRDLDNVLLEKVALIREHEAWQTKDGKWARTYGFADGSASRVESDDDFRSWDAQYVIPPGSSR